MAYSAFVVAAKALADHIKVAAPDLGVMDGDGDRSFAGFHKRDVTSPLPIERPAVRTEKLLDIVERRLRQTSDDPLNQLLDLAHDPSGQYRR